MQAVIRTGGKQYLVEPNQTLEVELLGDGKKFEFETLMVIDGTKVELGQPLLERRVKAELVEQTKADKIKVLKYKPKKRYKKLTGHRQRLARVKITSIG